MNVYVYIVTPKKIGKNNPTELVTTWLPLSSRKMIGRRWWNNF